jgi:hypothetical protein
MYHPIPVIEGYTRKQVISFVKIKLLTNREWRIRALNMLFNLQADREKYNYISHGDNGIGFSEIDSLKLTTIVRNFRKKIEPTKDQEKYLKIKIPRYAAQVARFSSAKKLKIALDNYFEYLKKPEDELFKVDNRKLKKAQKTL